jgi:BirA family biotin operon repressor/biotin-[acetyl-CoA-carboxylase] ligase
MTPFDIEAFAPNLTTRVFGRTLIFYDTVASTMDVARAQALGGAEEGTLALADEQTAGRGRMGRSWFAPPASNLLLTIVLRPPAHIVRRIAMIAPLAVCHAVEDIAGLRPDIKWPNDVQIAGKKLAGILIEQDTNHPARPFVLAGVGINVNFDPREHDEIRDTATSLCVELGREVEREPLLASFLVQFERLYDAAKRGESPYDAWRARLVTIGQPVTVTSPGNSIEGVAEDVDAEGALVVRTDDGQRVTIEAGDVTLRT